MLMKPYVGDSELQTQYVSGWPRGSSWTEVQEHPGQGLSVQIRKGITGTPEGPGLKEGSAPSRPSREKPCLLAPQEMGATGVAPNLALSARNYNWGFESLSSKESSQKGASSLNSALSPSELTPSLPHRFWLLSSWADEGQNGKA
jgi:hypothetical protein